MCTAWQIDIDQRIGGCEAFPRRGGGAVAIDDPRVAAQQRGMRRKELLARDLACCRVLDQVERVERQPGDLGQAPRQRGFAAARIAEHRHPLHRVSTKGHNRRCVSRRLPIRSRHGFRRGDW
jgi:hypothetical protein